MTLKNPKKISTRQIGTEELSERLNALQTAMPGVNTNDPREKELQTVLHELEVYQIELEMQVRELRESREALEESHDRYMSLFDFAPVGYVTLDEAGSIDEINLTAANMLGTERRWLVGRSFAPWILRDELPLYRTHLSASGQQDGRVQTTLHLARRDKQIIPVELLTTCTVHPQTGAKLYRTSITDLTERKKAEADLDRFFNLSNDLLCIIGNDGYFKRLNPMWEKTLGYTNGELLSRPFLDFVHADDREATSIELLRMGQEGKATHPYRYVKKDRSVLWLTWSAVTSGGSAYCVARDTSFEVNARLAIEQSERDLSKKVGELRIERELREQFVAALSHDLRTPLTAAKMGAQLIARKDLDREKTLRVAASIDYNMDRADQMIRDLLDASRIKAGEPVSLNINECSLNKLAKKTIDNLATVLGERFVIEAPNQIRGYWDKTALTRIIENLASNAVKYGSKDDPITIRLTQDRGNIEISVHNLGNPISGEEQQMLFEPYHRSRSASKSEQKGWGIGLTLVKGLAEAHGGNICVWSSEKGGTTFSVRLPQDARTAP